MQGSESSGSESPMSPRGGRRWSCPSPITGDESSDSEADEPSTNIVTQNVPSPHSDSPPHGAEIALRPKSPHCKHGHHRVLDQGGDRVALRLCFAHQHATTGAARAAKCPVHNNIAVLASGSGEYSDCYGSNMSVRLEEMGRAGGSSWGIGRDSFAKEEQGKWMVEETVD
jgi:hypothetical protein